MEIIKQSPGVLKSRNSPLDVSSVGRSRIWGARCPFRAMLHRQVADLAKRATVLRYAEGNSWGAGSIFNGREQFQPNTDDESIHGTRNVRRERRGRERYYALIMKEVEVDGPTRE